MSTDEAAHGEQQSPDDIPRASPTSGPPDLTTAATAAEFMELLRELRRHTGLSYKKIAKLWKQKYGKDARERSTVGDLFKKDRLPRLCQQLEQVLTLLAEASFDDPRVVERYVQRSVEHAKRLQRPRMTTLRTDQLPQGSRQPAGPAEEDLEVARIAAAADFMLRLSKLLTRLGLDEQQLAKRWKQRYPQDGPDNFEVNWWCTGLTVPTWNSDWTTHLTQLLTLLAAECRVEESEIRLYLEHGQGLLGAQLDARTQQDSQPAQPAWPAQDPSVPASTGIDDDTPAEPVPVILILGEGVVTVPGADTLTKTVLPQQHAQPHPRSKPVRALSALMCLLRVGSSEIVTLVARAPWWLALGALVGISLLVAVGSSLMRWL